MSLPVHKADTRRGWLIALRTGSALAAGMGVGRFVFAPILPLMEHQAGLNKSAASLLATGNYLGYFIGAIIGIALPTAGRARCALQTAGALLVLSLAMMPMTDIVTVWLLTRTFAGLCSAVVFMVAANTILTELAGSDPHLAGWAYGGIGAGIAVSGLLILAVQPVGDWRFAWWSAALLTAVLLAVSWREGVHPDPGQPRSQFRRTTRHRPWYALLTLSYFLEGAGYIIAGTFLVAAVSAAGPHWLSGSVWTIVGLAALPSCAAWGWLSGHTSRPVLITIALLLQALGMALPAVSTSVAAAILSAVLFGGSFVGASILTLATGRHLGISGAVAVLTSAYGIGQVVGPLVVTPLLDNGYRTALLAGSGIVMMAAVASALMRIQFPARAFDPDKSD